VARLRRKIDGDRTTSLIHTVRGVGFELTHHEITEPNPAR